MRRGQGRGSLVQPHRLRLEVVRIVTRGRRWPSGSKEGRRIRAAAASQTRHAQSKTLEQVRIINLFRYFCDLIVIIMIYFTLLGPSRSLRTSGRSTSRKRGKGDLRVV